MDYLEGLKVLNKIEQDYEVMTIQYRGISIWPYLRIYIFDSITSQRAKSYTPSALKMLLKDLFFYNPLCFFKKYDVWNCSSRITRKDMNGIYEHHVSGGLHKLGMRLLTIEGPAYGVSNIKRSSVPEKNIVSSSWFTLLFGVLEILLRIKPLRIENEDVLSVIKKKYGVNIDFNKRIRYLFAQKLVFDFLFLIGHRPKLIIMECSYTQMGNIWSAHNHGIPVVELQHGVINEHHYAYRPTYHSDILYPDEMCVYGDIEYNFFKSKGSKFVSKVSKVGLYILGQSDIIFSEDIFGELRNNYESIIVIAGQSGFESQLATFIDKVAECLPQALFVYIPRRNDEQLEFTHSNIHYVTEVNIYEYLKWCDIHVTISSTTGIEAHYFRKPVIFCDFNNRAYTYYSNIINKDNGAWYIKDVSGFIQAYNSVRADNYIYKELFSPNNQYLMKNVLDRYLK